MRRLKRPLGISLLLVAASALVLGCASGNEEMPVDQKAVSASLIQLKDLPTSAKTESDISMETCDPLEILNSGNSKTGKSSAFALGKVKIQEAVGIFDEERVAEDAYIALGAEPRQECIRSVVALQGELSAEVLSSRDLKLGDEAKLTLFQVTQLNSGKQGLIGVVSLRSGSSVASLLLIATLEEFPDAVVEDVVDIAHQRLIEGRESN